MNIEELLKKMEECNIREHELRESYSSLEEINQFYNDKNNLAEAFVKMCAKLSPQELQAHLGNHKISYEEVGSDIGGIVDKISVSLDNGSFTIFPSRVQNSEALGLFVQNCVSENNPLVNGTRTADEIKNAYNLRKKVGEIKRTIGRTLQYYSPGDIANYIQLCCYETYVEDDKSISDNAKYMLAVLQSAILTDSGVKMPSDAEVARSIIACDRGEIDFSTMIFEMKKELGLYHELHTVEEVAEYYEIPESDAEAIFEAEKVKDGNGWDTVSVRKDPYNLYLIIQNGHNMVTAGFVKEEELPRDIMNSLSSKEYFTIEDVRKAIEGVTRGEVDSAAKDIIGSEQEAVPGFDEQGQ